MAARYKAPAIKVDAKKIETYRRVWTSAVGPLGPVHRLGVYADGSASERTVCGNWPGRATPPDIQDNLCPVCFRNPRPSERTSK